MQALAGQSSSLAQQIRPLGMQVPVSGQHVGFGSVHVETSLQTPPEQAAGVQASAEGQFESSSAQARKPSPLIAWQVWQPVQTSPHSEQLSLVPSSTQTPGLPSTAPGQQVSVEPVQTELTAQA